MWVPVVVRPGCITLLNRYTSFTYFATCSDRRIVNVCVMMQLAADGEHWWVSWEKRIHVADGVWEPLPRPHRRCQGTAAEKVCCSLPSLVMVIQRWMWPAFIHVLDSTTASSFGCQPSTDSSATSTGYIWWSDICCHRSFDVELPAEKFMWPF